MKRTFFIILISICIIYSNVFAEGLLEKRRSVYANGILIGTTNFIGQETLQLKFNDSFWVSTLLTDSGELTSKPYNFQLFFRLADCEGEPYTYAYGRISSSHIKPYKSWIRNYEGKLYYVMPFKENVYRQLVILSEFNSASYSCNNSSYKRLTNIPYFKLRPNDPAITGIQTYPFPLPITTKEAPQAKPQHEEKQKSF